MGWNITECDTNAIVECYWHSKVRVLGKVVNATRYTFRNRHRHSRIWYEVKHLFYLNRTPSMDTDYKFRAPSYYWREDVVKIICKPKKRHCDDCKYKFVCYTTRI